jgi:hypothetical protein
MGVRPASRSSTNTLAPAASSGHSTGRRPTPSAVLEPARAAPRAGGAGLDGRRRAGAVREARQRVALGRGGRLRRVGKRAFGEFAGGHRGVGVAAATAAGCSRTPTA